MGIDGTSKGSKHALAAWPGLGSDVRKNVMPLVSGAVTISILGGVLFGCAGREPSTTACGANPPGCVETVRGAPRVARPYPLKQADQAVLREIKGLLRPFQSIQEAWIARSDVIFVGEYYTTLGPCISIEGGSMMPSFSCLRVESELKGKVITSAWNLTIDVPGDYWRAPVCMVEGRRYLVFLARRVPLEDVLLDPYALYRFDNGIRDGHVVAIVDLSAAEWEVEAGKVLACRSADYRGFQFTPDVWQACRAAETMDLTLQKRLLAFLQGCVLKDGATVAEVRSYLGPPDDARFCSEDGAKPNRSQADAQTVFRCGYTLNQRIYLDRRTGKIFTQVKMTFDNHGRLCHYVIDNCRAKKQGAITVIQTIKPGEAAALGLPSGEWMPLRPGDSAPVPRSIASPETE